MHYLNEKECLDQNMKHSSVFVINVQSIILFKLMKVMIHEVVHINKETINQKTSLTFRNWRCFGWITQPSTGDDFPFAWSLYSREAV